MATTSPVSTPAGRASKSGLPRWLAAAGVVAAVALAYAGSLRAPFLFDDTGAVLNNPTIRHLNSLAVLNPPADGSTTTGRPVVNLSFAVNYAISGEAPWSYHALNVAIHALAALTLLGLARRTLAVIPTSRSTPTSHSQDQGVTWCAFAIALLWALHPLQTESVICIAQRTESLCSLCYLLALYGFVRGVDPVVAGLAEAGPGSATPATVIHSSTGRPSGSAFQRIWLGLSVLSCLVGMATKEVMVTAPVIILLYDRTFVAGSFAAAWRRRRIYYAGLAGTWLLLAWLLLRGGGARGAAAGFGLGVTWWSYLLTQCEAIVLYLKLCFWPYPLVLDYGTAVAHSLAEVWWQAAVVVALLAGTGWALWRRPALGFAGAWFFVILSPSSSVVPLVTQTMAEHRMYLPLAGVIGVAVLTLYRQAGSRAAVALVGVALAFGAMTVARNLDYNDTVGIWADTVARRPLNARAHNNLAWALQLRGKSEEANAQFARAIELQPDYVSARYNWGVALLDQHRAEEAIAQFAAAVRLAPNHADACVNLGNALMQVQRAADAVPQYEAALRLRPGADVNYDLGVALLALDRVEEAALQFRLAIQSQPELAEAHYQLAAVCDRAGQAAEAEQEYAETLRRSPGHVAAHGRLGLLLARSGHPAEAAAEFEAIIRLRPDDADARANLGNVLLMQGKAREAIASYEEALRLRPDDARARENLQLARESLR